MNDFFGEGLSLGSAPARPQKQDLGAYGSAGTDLLGYAPGPSQLWPIDFTIGNYWGKANGILAPLVSSDKVVIAGYAPVFDEHLSIGGKVYASGGYLLSQAAYITVDGSGNLLFTDGVTGGKTLAQLFATVGNVLYSGTPVAGQPASWVNATTIQGIAISSLTLAQSQVTGLVTALSGKASTIHNFIDTTNHPVSGLTPGHFLKALTATTYGFAAHGLTSTDIGLGSVTNHAQVRKASSSTNNALVVWDGSSGVLVKDSVITLNTGIGVSYINVPSGYTYNVNGVPHTHGSTYQLLDDTLVALAALDSATGFLYQTGVDTFTKYSFAGTGVANSVARGDHYHPGLASFIEGTPAATQVVLWHDAAKLEGNAGFTYDGTDLIVTGNIRATGNVSAYDVGAPINWWDDMPMAQAWVSGPYPALGGIIIGANLTIDANGVVNASGGAGATNWGLIGGTIASQTDLGIALGLKLDASAYTAADVLSKLLTVDGSTSTLDADLLDTYHASAFPRKAEDATITGTWQFSGHTAYSNGYYAVKFSGDMLIDTGYALVFGTSIDSYFGYGGGHNMDFVLADATNDTYYQFRGKNAVGTLNTLITAYSRAGVTLYFEGGAKLATTTGGATITGELTTTGGNSTNWQTAYTWGNHASVGYALLGVVTTANFSILQESGKLVIKYGTTVIASIDSSGFIKAASNIQGYTTL